MIYVERYNPDRHYEKVLNMRLREADRRELLASSGHESGTGLVSSVNQSDIVCYAYMNDDKLIALSGAGHTPLKGFASVWAMGTDDVVRHFNEIEPLFAQHVNSILDYPDIKTIGNVIDLRNEAHIRWIQKLGFSMTDRITVLGGFEFELFYKGRNPKM